MLTTHPGQHSGVKVMPYAVSYDVAAPEPMYWKVKEAMGEAQPQGLVLQLVIQIENGLRHIGVWNSQEDWDRFNAERIRPAIHTVLTAAGFSKLPPDPPVKELKVVDVLTGPS